MAGAPRHAPSPTSPPPCRCERVRAAQAGLLADIDRARGRALRTRRDRRSRGIVMTSHASEPIAVVGVSAIMPDAPDARDVLGQHPGRPLQHQRRAAGAVGSGAVLRPRPARTGQDLLAHRRLGARVRLGPDGVEAADAARGRRADGRRPEVGGRRQPARRCSTPAGRSGPSTRSGSRSIIGNAIGGEKHYDTNLRIEFPSSPAGCAARRRSPRCPQRRPRRRARRRHGTRSWPASPRSPRTRCPASWPTSSPAGSPTCSTSADPTSPPTPPAPPALAAM